MDLNRLMGSLEKRCLPGLIQSMSTFSSSYSQREKHTCSKAMDAKRTDHTYIQSHLDNPVRTWRKILAAVVPDHLSDDYRLRRLVHSHLSNPQQTRLRDRTTGPRRHIPRLDSMRVNNSQRYLKSLAWIQHVPFAGLPDRSQAYTRDCARIYLQA